MFFYQNTENTMKNIEVEKKRADYNDVVGKYYVADLHLFYLVVYFGSLKI